MAVRAQSTSPGSKPYFNLLVWDTFGLTHVQSASWLGRQHNHTPVIRDRLLREVFLRSMAVVGRDPEKNSTTLFMI